MASVNDILYVEQEEERKAAVSGGALGALCEGAAMVGSMGRSKQAQHHTASAGRVSTRHVHLLGLSRCDESDGVCAREDANPSRPLAKGDVAADITTRKEPAAMA